ncbi:MAG: hypothetical protein ACI8R4_004313, partial [Paracoccaceae bacterium]
MAQDNTPNAADTAYAAALAKIERVRAAGGTRLWLDDDPFHALNRIPPEIAELDNLEYLHLSRTQVSDLAPLKALSELQGLYLDQTQVSDLAPLRTLTGLNVLTLDQTQVSDLRPIRSIPELIDSVWSKVWFGNTPAARSSPELIRLSQIKDAEDRTRKTLAYLKTLPPWPEPLPWEVDQESTTPSGPTVQPTKPTVQPAPLMVAFENGLLRQVPLTHGMQGDVAARAAQGWRALQAYLKSLAPHRQGIHNAMPAMAHVLDLLGEYLAAEDPDTDNAILFGMQADRLIRLAQGAPDVLSDPIAAEDLLQFALELGRFVARDPVWMAYKSDPLPSPDTLQKFTLAVPQLREFERTLKQADWVDPTIAVTFGEIITQAQDIPGDPIAVKGALDSTTGVLNEIAAEAASEVRELEKSGLWIDLKKELRKKSITGVAGTTLGAATTGIGIAADVMINNAGIITSLAAEFPGTFGYALQVLQYL